MPTSEEASVRNIEKTLGVIKLAWLATVWSLILLKLMCATGLPTCCIRQRDRFQATVVTHTVRQGVSGVGTSKRSGQGCSSELQLDVQKAGLERGDVQRVVCHVAEQGWSQPPAPVLSIHVRLVRSLLRHDAVDREAPGIERGDPMTVALGRITVV
jgi:hypothetical protein